LSPPNIEERISRLKSAFNILFCGHFFEKKRLDVVGGRRVVVLHRHRSPKGIPHSGLEVACGHRLGKRDHHRILRHEEHVIVVDTRLGLADVAKGEVQARAGKQRRSGAHVQDIDNGKDGSAPSERGLKRGIFLGKAAFS
jgi:hypothetical protein